MAFGFSNQGNAMLGSTAGGGGLNQGPELEVIQTEALGFKSIAGDAKLRLTSAWSPAPADTASLLSIAPRRGLVAAAGPDGITIASTESVRKGFEADSKESDSSDVRAFQPQVKLPMPMRVSQLAFSADENYLILSAESGGGLAVYETQSLLNGGTQAAFELATNGETLRALVPNPTIEKAELVAIVTNNGNLHMANLKDRNISNVLKAQVSCLSWSTKGKQLVAGLADGTIFQMTPEGEEKGQIPRPPGVENAHVSSLSWLENHLFLAIHTSTKESPPTSVYHIITRKLPSDFTFQKLTDPVDPFGAENTPHHSILRLKDFPPNLTDLLIVASTASPDIGLLSRSKTPLSPDKPADSISNVFTTTELLDDSKRASLPMTEDFQNTVPIGVALDLSSKEKVYKPLPADEELEDSPGPLPGFWVLNHEGVLSSWWIVTFGSGNKSVFGSGSTPTAAATPSSGGGFAGFASSGGFGSLGNKNANEGGSVFGSKPSSSPFGSGQSPFSSTKDTAFPPPSQKPSSGAGVNPFAGQPFKLESSFKPDPSAKDDADDEDEKPATSGGSSFFGGGFSSALGDAKKQTTPTKEQSMDTTEETPKPKSVFDLPSTTPKETPAPNKGLFGLGTAPQNGRSLFSKPSPKSSSSGFKLEPQSKTPTDAPLPPDSTSRVEYPLGESSSSSGGASKASPKAGDAPLPPDFLTTPKASQTKAVDDPLPPDFLKPKQSTKSSDDAPLPPDFITPKPSKAVPSTTPPTALPLPAEEKPKQTAPAAAPDFLKMPKQSLTQATWSSTPVSETPAKEPEDAPLPPDFITKPKTNDLPAIPTVPDSDHDSDLEEDEEGSEGSGVDVAKDLSPSIVAMTPNAGLTPQSSFGGVSSSTYSIPRTEEERPRHSLFGNNVPTLPRPSQTSPRSPSPVRAAIPGRLRQESARSVSAPGMASQILGAQRKQPSQMGMSIVGSKTTMEDPFVAQQRLARQRRQAEETRTLEDEEDDEIQKILASKIEPSLKLDDFIAHSNVVPSAKETIPAQVEAVYRDINSMIDTLGLNARSLASFIVGHDVGFKQGGRRKEDLENPEDWVLSEIDELGEVIDRSLARDLEYGRVQDVEEKLEACNELAREMSRLRSKQDDLKKIMMVRLDPDQADISRSLPLSAEQAAQQNELRREYANFSKLLAEVEEALTLLKTKLASVSSASGKGNSNVPTVEAVMRTINKMTSMVEKRSGDIDVLENQMRKLRFSSVNSREGSPMATPQRNSRSLIFSPERMATASPGTLRNSLVSSVASYGVRGTPPRKKLSGFSQDEKSELMAKRAKRQAVLNKLKANVERAGVSVWTLEDAE
ncbi:Nucleoporin NUP159 [Colletotrichum sp. SAR 10_86]|nr:Nucleoporin NUP159 [Colletotrichum sp. SAR 10_77]KAI8218941.1 Nucleoporin NUP159 [Colletotrichum sp. SAR 10_86]KAJ4995672.1 Nucleoporin NUP159 [Colletotrichum sp. SAR 10_66]